MSPTPPTPRLGAHMSIAGGLPKAVDRALEIQATALQVFVKSARQWQAPPLDRCAARDFRGRLEETGLGAFTLAHASYLINLASADSVTRRRSISALRAELSRCGQLRIPYLVLHPGSHLGAGEEVGLERVAEALDRVLRPTGRTTNAPVLPMVLLENTAGQGSNLGHRFEHLGSIREMLRHPERVGVCIDTCHALAAGYPLSGAAGYRRSMLQLDRAVGLRQVRAFHLNDSRHGLGSRRDRHEHIGNGEVGLDGFRRLLNDVRFRERPMVLETPKGDDLSEDRVNLGVLRSLIRADGSVS